MSIHPLPVYEADADPRHRSAMTDQEIYDQLEPPKTIVVRFGSMKLVGEYPYDGDAKPGCGSKMVVRTHRGTEIGEMLTSTCPNAGCSKSVTRNEMLEYIENSGGSDYPFYTNGKVLRVATVDDLNAQSALDTTRQAAVRSCKARITELGLKMKLVEAEPILGGELLTFYYMSEERVDFRELVRQLASEFKTRIEMRQVGARDEARLVADYERCGQHCCCKQFLKVLKPVSMSAAKRQKATLEPLKISGRCGRLMCCLRYEDQTYKELKQALPRRKSRVGTEEGPGIVLDTKVLVQLVLVRLDYDGKEIAVPVEELMDPDNCPPPGTKPKAEADPFRGLEQDDVAERTDDHKRGKKRDRQQDDYRAKSKRADGDEATDDSTDARPGEATDKPQRKRRRRGGRRRRSGRGRDNKQDQGRTPEQGGNAGGSAGNARSEQTGEDSPSDGGSKKRRRRGGRRRGGRGRRGGKGRGGDSGSGGNSGGGSGGNPGGGGDGESG